MPLLTLALPFTRTILSPIPLMLSLETPVWAQNLQCLQQIVVFNAMSQGIFMSTAQNTSVPTVISMSLAIPNTIATATTVLFATASATPLATVRTTFVPSAMTQAMLSLTAPFWRTPAAGSFSTMEILRVYDLAPVVQVFKGGNVMIQGSDLFFSIIYLLLLSSDLPFTFTVLVMFHSNIYCYIIW